MKTLINIIALMPALASAVSTIILFILSFEYVWLVIPIIFQSIGTIYLADNAKNIALGIHKLVNIIIS